MNKQPALFFDRDGVLIEDVHLLVSKDFIKFIPNVGNILADLRRRGWKLILVTNQTVVARGLLSYEEATQLNNLVLKQLKQLNNSAYFDAVYLCPHHPHATVEEYKKNCECRKPKPGMLFQASKEYNIDLSKSFMIGDRISDLIAGNIAGCNSILLDNGNLNKPLIESDLTILEVDKNPDFVIKILDELPGIVGDP